MCFNRRNKLFQINRAFTVSIENVFQQGKLVNIVEFYHISVRGSF